MVCVTDFFPRDCLTLARVEFFRTAVDFCEPLVAKFGHAFLS
jgi:hypothetical protein